MVMETGSLIETYGPHIDRIVYTASLATRSEDVDGMLDALRVITSQVNRDDPVSDSRKKDMADIQRQLEQYLLTKEKVRSYTPDSLKLQISLHMQGNNYTKRTRVQLWATVGVALATAFCLAVFLPLKTPDQRGLVGGATTFSLLTVGAALLFLTALPAFKSELRRAFGLICGGVALLGLSLLGQPIMEILGLRQYTLTSILYTIPILIAAILFHTGDALYARILGVKNWWTGIMPLIIGAIVMITFSYLVPHPATSEPESIHDLVAAMWGVMLLTPTCSAIVLAMTVPRVSDLYKSPLRWLFLSMFPIIAVVSYQYIVRIVAGPYMHGVVAYVLFSLVTLMGLALMQAAYSFNKVSRY